jgi:uracil-DNA glycosylase
MNYNALFGESWGPKLQEEISPKKLKYIFDTLKDESSQAEIFPKPEKIFRCLKECPIDKTMVVILGANPYYSPVYKDKVDGLLFSTSEKTPTQVEKVIFAAVESNYDDKMGNYNSDLSDWAKQGVLLLPLDLTTSSHNKGAFIRLWSVFIEAVLRTIQTHCPGAIFVLLGQDALRIQDSLDPLNHDMVLLEHPVKALLMKRNWKHKNIFNYLDRVTNMIHGRKVDWLRRN